MATQDTIRSETMVAAQAKAKTRPAWLPERWYAHIVLWLACIFVGFPMIYALLISTQSNDEVNRYLFVPGTAFQTNWNLVMSRNLWTFMGTSAVMTIAITVGKTILSLLAGLAFVYFRFP